MKIRAILIASLLFMPAAAQSQQTPPTSTMVPAKIMGHFKGPHVLACNRYLPADALGDLVPLHAEFTTVVNPDGTVKSVDVKDDSGNPDINKALVTCAMNWVYVPATVDGKPVESTSTSFQTMAREPYL
ncbi:MAG TPA: energy transducer TonB [Rhizomicrobium sp.]|jgi:hypothetical protein|nr:energy transducer TonB [Rhizomicrobium sp.]